jgi:hypothetical protein
MKEELYIDIVSKTIIARMSESVAQYAGEALSRSMQKLMATEVPAAISKEITPAFEKVRKDRESAESQAKDDAGKKFDSLAQKITENAETINNLITSTLSEQIESLVQTMGSGFENISKETKAENTIQKDNLKQGLQELNTTFAEGLNGQTEMICANLADEIKTVSAGLPHKIDDLSKVIKKYSDASGASLTKDMEEFRNTIKSMGNVSDSTMAESLESLQKEISSGLEQSLAPILKFTEKISSKTEGTEQLLGDFKTLFSEQTNQSDINQKSLLASVENLQEKLASVDTASSKDKEKSGKQIKEALNSLFRQMEESRERQDETLAEDLQGHILKNSKELADGIGAVQKDIATVLQKLQQEKLAQSADINETIDDGLSSLHDAFESSRLKLQDDFKKVSQQLNATAKDNRLQSVSVADEINKIESFLRESIDPLRADIANLKSQEKDGKHDGMGSLKSFIETNLISRITAIEDANERLHSETEAAREQADKHAKKQGDLLTSIVYTIKKMSKSSPETDVGISEKIESVIDMSIEGMKEHMQRERVNNQTVNSQLNKLINEVEGTTQNQNDLLNSIFYSMKKLTSTYDQREEGSNEQSDKVEVALKGLHRLIRRLEGQKDDAYTELIRIAGDDFLKGKLEEQEEAITKANELAEKRHQENKELEKKIEQLQLLWESNAD